MFFWEIETAEEAGEEVDEALAILEVRSDAENVEVWVDAEADEDFSKADGEVDWVAFLECFVDTKVLISLEDAVDAKCDEDGNADDTGDEERAEDVDNGEDDAESCVEDCVEDSTEDDAKEEDGAEDVKTEDDMRDVKVENEYDATVDKSRACSVGVAATLKALSTEP